MIQDDSPATAWPRPCCRRRHDGGASPSSWPPAAPCCPAPRSPRRRSTCPRSTLLPAWLHKRPIPGPLGPAPGPAHAGPAPKRTRARQHTGTSRALAGPAPGHTWARHPAATWPGLRRQAGVGRVRLGAVLDSKDGSAQQAGALQHRARGAPHRPRHALSSTRGSTPSCGTDSPALPAAPAAPPSAPPVPQRGGGGGCWKPCLEMLWRRREDRKEM